MATTKEEIINLFINNLEGSYNNDPDDSGKETNYGITLDVARASGYHDNMRDMPRDIACEIYAVKYWDYLSLDRVVMMSMPIAEKLLDVAAHCGTTRAAKFFQRTLNNLNNRGVIYPDIKVDGLVGNRTINAFMALIDFRGCDGKNVALIMLNCLHGKFLFSLTEKRETDEKWIYGWFKKRIKI